MEGSASVKRMSFEEFLQVQKDMILKALDAMRKGLVGTVGEGIGGMHYLAMRTDGTVVELHTVPKYATPSHDQWDALINSVKREYDAGSALFAVETCFPNNDGNEPWGGNGELLDRFGRDLGRSFGAMTGDPKAMALFARIVHKQSCFYNADAPVDRMVGGDWQLAYTMTSRQWEVEHGFAR